MSTNPVHIYRHLLREVSYLPNHQSRVFFRQHVVRSFRQYLPKVISRHGARKKTIWTSADTIEVNGQAALQNVFPSIDQALTKPPSKPDPSVARIRIVPSITGNPPPSRCKPTKWAIERETALLARARKYLSFLRRANDGHYNSLEKMLQWTYGRKGKLNHELAAKFVVNENLQDKHTAMLEDQETQHEQVATESTITENDDNDDNIAEENKNKPVPSSSRLIALRGLASIRFEPPYKPPPVLTALLASQARQSNTTPAHQTIVKQSLLSMPKALPKTNIWGHPMPKCRITNANRNWFVKAMENLLPPLENEKDWDTLWDLATGTTKLVGVDRKNGTGDRKRRPVARRRVFSKAALSTPIAGAVHGNSHLHPADLIRDDEDVDPIAELAIHGPRKGQTYQDYYAHGRPHKITDRYLRRHVARVLQHTPRLRAAPGSRHGVIVQWSNAALARDRFSLPTPTDSQRKSLFG